MPEKQLCPVCLKSGRSSALKSFQVNFDEALWLCEYKRCIYPLGQDNEPIFNRKFDDIPSEKDIQTRVPSAQLNLQMQVASRLTECHQKIQKDVIGIQTGSPLFMKTKARQKGLKRGSNGVRNLHNSLKSPSLNGANNQPQSFKTTNLSNGNIAPASDLLNGNLNGFNGNADLSDLFNGNLNGTAIFEGLQLGQSKSSQQEKISLSNNGSVSFNDAVIQNSNILMQNGNTFDPSLYSSVKKPLPLQNGHNQNENGSIIQITATNTKPTFVNGPVCATNATNTSVVNGSLSQNKTQFLQWKNKEALCWLDVLLCLLVHNKTLKQAVMDEKQSDSLVYRLIQAHKQATLLLTNQRHGGGAMEKSVNKNSSQMGPEKSHHAFENGNRNPIDKVDTAQMSQGSEDPSEVLNEIREEIWSFLHKKIHCEKGIPASPVLALPELLHSDPTADSVFRSKYKCIYDCLRCKFLEDTDCDSLLPSLPAVVKQFSISSPVHKKKCLNCSYTKGERQMLYKKLPKSFLMHFIDGLPPGQWSDLEFTFNGNLYTVTGVVQYRRNPDHFVSWLRNPHDNTWTECDDLKRPLNTARSQPPRFSWKQIHIVMWEQVNGDIVSSIPAFTETLAPMKGVAVDDMKRLNGNPVITNGCSENNRNLTNGVASMISSRSELTFEPVVPNASRTINYTSGVSMPKSSPTIPESVASTSNQNGSLLKSRHLSGQNEKDEQNGLDDNSLPKQQISIDTHKFLNSSTESSLVNGRSGSSLSSTCSDLSDSISLPEFISTAQLENNLIRPIPCRNESPVQNSEFMNRNSCEADPNLAQVVTKDNKLDAVNETKTKLNRYVRGKMDSNSSVHVDSQCKKLVPNIEPSSVFLKPLKCAALKDQPKSLAVDSDKQSDSVVSKLQTSTSNSASVVSTLTEYLRPTSVKDSGIVNNPIAGVNIKSEPSMHEESSLNNKSRFKLPTMLRTRSRHSRISRDAFQTLPKPTEKKEISPTVSPRMSPSASMNSPYLSAVKHYLINKTTDISQPKTRFEGLSLKSAPHLNKTVDLSDLKRNDFSPVVSGSSSSHSSSKKSVTTALTDTLMKRRKTPSDEKSLKRLKTTQNPSSNAASTLTHSLSRKSPTFISDLVAKNKGHAIVVMKTPDKNYPITPDKNNPVQNIGTGAITYSSTTCVQRSNKENGNSVGTPDKTKTIDTSHTMETDSVLQDLYDALNIPFTSIKETMSDIMVDVNDILGVVETADVIPVTPQKTDIGNQGQLDCGQSLTNRLTPQSDITIQHKDWSNWTRVNKLLLIS